jgi:hypothetical protein
VKLDLDAKLGELGDKAIGFDLGGAAVEMVGAEILMVGPPRRIGRASF